MKKTVMATMVIVLAFGMVSASFAQAAGPRSGQQQGQGQRGQGQAGGQRMQMNPEMQKKIKAAHDKVIKELKLNANQTKAVAAAVTKRDAATKKMRDQIEKDRKAGKQIDRTKMQESSKKIRDTYNAEMKKAMGDANYKKYETRMQEEMKKIFEAARKNGQAGGGKAGGKSGG